MFIQGIVLIFIIKSLTHHFLELWQLNGSSISKNAALLPSTNPRGSCPRDHFVRVVFDNLSTLTDQTRRRGGETKSLHPVPDKVSTISPNLLFQYISNEYTAIYLPLILDISFAMALCQHNSLVSK